MYMGMSHLETLTVSTMNSEWQISFPKVGCNRASHHPCFSAVELDTPPTEGVGSVSPPLTYLCVALTSRIG